MSRITPAMQVADRGRLAGCLLLVATLTLACTSSDDGAQPPSTASTTTTLDPDRQVDPATLQIHVVPPGGGTPYGSATLPGATEPLPDDYQETEYLVAGRAARYTGPATGPAIPDEDRHPFSTRVLIRKPADPADFSGRVWVEPFNTSAGTDFDVLWSMLGPLIIEQGDAWVGMTVRSNQVAKLQAFDAERYADLDLEDNAYAWDALRSVGTLLRLNPAQSPLHGYDVERVYMGGYSQSAVDAATFAASFNGLTRIADGSPVYDGYLLGAHAGNLSPLQSGESIIPAFEAAPIPPVDVPVIDIQSQTDVEGFAVEVPTELARQGGVPGAEEIDTPTFTYTNVGGARVRRENSDVDGDRYALLEIAGAPHASGGGGGCEGSSSFPIHYFTRAAAAMLTRWAENGAPPPDSARIELATLDDVSIAANDEVGNALGGVRSPFLDVPLSRYEVHSGPAPTCKLTGEETPLATDVLADRFGDAASYMQQFSASLDDAIGAGVLLELDRQSIITAQQAQANAAFG